MMIQQSCILSVIVLIVYCITFTIVGLKCSAVIIIEINYKDNVRVIILRAFFINISLDS